MNLKDFFSILGQFSDIQGSEGKLRRRHRNGLLATVAMILFGLVKVIVELSDNNEFILEYLTRVWHHTLIALRYLWLVITLQWDSLATYNIVYDVMGVYIILAGVVIYMLNRHTAFLFSMSEEPFQYTFWINRFQRAEDRNVNKNVITEDDPVHHLLHHDLMEMLNRRIGRFSLLEEGFSKTDSDHGSMPPNHIHIDGHYAIRNRKSEKNEVTVIQVMPRIRIGPKDSPSVLTFPVEVELYIQDEVIRQTGSQEDAKKSTDKEADYVGNSLFNHDNYNEVLEQVYSRVASEIYKQIKSDIKQKLHLFPTNNLKAVALYYEAEDFSRSNTIDSYNYAIELYQEALRLYDISMRFVVSSWLLKCEWLQWLRHGIKYQSMYASTRIGYAKCLIYRREVSSFTGRATNPLYEVPGMINQVVNRLIRLHNKFHIWKWKIVPYDGYNQEEPEPEQIWTKNRMNLTRTSLLFQKDTWQNKFIWRKLSIARFEKLKKLLFDAYVVLALAYAEMGAVKMAEEYLKYAKATDPGRYNNNALFLLAQAVTLQDLKSRIPLLIQATEMTPDFEIAQYMLAMNMLNLFLYNGEIQSERAKTVIKEFRKVLEINPGNIATFSHLGYLYWLIDDMDHAEEQFNRGIRTKAIIQQTFIGELNYGLARIYARDGAFNQCYTLYSESLETEPGLGAFSTESVGQKTRAISYYDYNTYSLLDRYRKYKQNFENQIRKVLVTFQKEDIKDYQGLYDAIKADKYRIFEPFIQKEVAFETGRGKKQGYPFSDAEWRDALNELLKDAQLCERILSVDESKGKMIGDIQKEAALKVSKKVDFDATDIITLAICNRLVLEKIYHQLFQLSSIDKYFEDYKCPRGLCEDGQKPISLTTLNHSYSFVLNDYGNACLNYYHRFGDTGQLNEAYTTLKRAVKLHPNNGIAYYNLANAVSWRNQDSYSNEGIQDKKQYLERAVESISITWPKVIIDLEKIRMDELLNNIEKENEAIVKNEKRLTDLLPEIEELERKMQIEQSLEKKDRNNFSETSRQHHVYGQQPEKLEKDLKAKITEQEKIEREIPKQKNKLKNMQRVFKNSFASAVSRTVEPSKFNGMIEEFGIDTSGRSIDRLVGIKIAPDLLDEKDIIALSGWANLLSSNKMELNAIKAAIRLCNYIAKYTLRSFDIVNILFEACLNLDELKIEQMLEFTGVDRLIDQDELRELLGEDKAGKLAGHDPGTILEDRDSLNRIKPRLSSPYLKPLEIQDPQNLLAKLINRRDITLPDTEIKTLTELQQKWRKEKASHDNQCVELAGTLNRLLKNRLYKEGSLTLKNLFQRDQKMIEFHLAEKLKSYDLIRFNRWLLEILFPEEICRSYVEFYRGRISRIIQDIWLVGDPVHFVALEWAKNFLSFPEMESHLKTAIGHATINVDMFHERLADLYEKKGYEDCKVRNLEKAIKVYPEQGFYYLRLSRAYSLNRRFEEAKGKIDEAEEKRIIPSDEYNRELKDILLDESTCLSETGEWQKAILKYQEALNFFPDDSVLQNKLTETEENYRNHRIGNHYGQKWIDQLPVVTPVIIEVATDLIPMIADKSDNLNEDLQEKIKNMREKIMEDFGVGVPGIRFRGNDGFFSNGTYMIMLSESPLVSGTVIQDHYLFTGTKAELEGLDIQTDETIDPLTGRPAIWIRDSDVGKLDSPVKPFRDAATYLINHLETVLRQNLVEFLGHQEVYYLISVKSIDKLDHYYAHPADLTRLTAICRGLVSEKVPITAFLSILSYAEQHSRESNITELINGIRLLPEISAKLPGNHDISLYLKLSAKVETKFKQATYNENGQYILAMVPETCQEVLTAVREKITDQENVAIIVTDQRLRSLVSQLLKLEFPKVPVIASNELLQPYVNNNHEISEI